jgi:hypothetical protein
MARIAAVPLALIVSLALLAGTVAGVDWVIGHASHLRIFERRGDALTIAETVGSIICIWFPLFFSGIFSQKNKKEDPVRLTPLVRRDPVTGRREL